MFEKTRQPILLPQKKLHPFIRLKKEATTVTTKASGNRKFLPRRKPTPPLLPGKNPSFHSLSKRYGEVMLLQFGSKPVVVASSARAAREIMKNQDLIFASRPKFSIADRLLYGGRDVAFSAYGDHWRQVMRISISSP
ncbi:hypothetical protein SASPL_153572 [Salvia splendens]|uniref:Uncharacterized protein n=1 Tax=Salvia splendens TaxID=180675 RepID=A0A8X8VYJ2_SALSN|nr:hypothetical protein SASPL_153572 [Salvia splendens]